MFSNFEKQEGTVRRHPTIYFKICSNIQKMTLDFIETLKMSIYRPKHIKNTKIHFKKKLAIVFFCKSIFSKSFKFNKSSVLCWFVLHYLFFMLRTTQPNQFCFIEIVCILFKGAFWVNDQWSRVGVQKHAPCLKRSARMRH